jgi:acyl-coenzyme A thioesterase PaaI-like protein
MNRVLKIYAQLKDKPFGRRIFSYLVARTAPYFLTIRPQVEEIRHNFIKVNLKNRRAVHNHLKAVHAIAMCNLCEFAGGVCMEASIPKHRRWIPVGMQVAYLKIAKTDLSATCDLSHVDWDNCDSVDCDIKVKDKHDVVVMTASITMKVSDKKK